MKKSRVATKHESELKALTTLPDQDIDTTDIPEAAAWQGAERGRFYRPVKKPISLRIDVDVLAWFRSQGEKYQSRINQALREYMHQKRA